MTFHNLNFFIFPLYFPRATRSTTWKFTHSIWFPFKYLILKAWDRQHLSSWWQTRAVSDLFLTLHHRLSPPFYLFALHQRLYWCLIIKAMMTIHIVSGLRCRRWWCVERLVGSFVGVCFFSSVFVYLAIMKHNSDSSIVLRTRQQWLLDCNTARLIFEVLFSPFVSTFVYDTWFIFRWTFGFRSSCYSCQRIIMSMHMNIA